MTQVTVSPGAGLSSSAGSPADRLTLIAQSPSGATPPAQQQLQTLPNGEGEVAVRDEFGNTLATTLKARQVLRNGQWRNEGFVAERMSAYGATAPRSNAQPEPNGYGYLRAERGKGFGRITGALDICADLVGLGLRAGDESQRCRSGKRASTGDGVHGRDGTQQRWACRAAKHSVVGPTTARSLLPRLDLREPS